MRRARLFGFVFLTFCCSCGAGDAADDVVVRQGAVAPPAPTILNASFEDDGTGVASPVGWVSSGSVNTDFTEFGGHTGDWRLSHWSAEAYSVDTAQTLSGLTDGWYTLRAWVRRSTGNNNSYVELACGHDTKRAYRAGVVAEPVAQRRRCRRASTTARAPSRCTRTATQVSGRTSTTSSSCLARRSSPFWARTSRASRSQRTSAACTATNAGGVARRSTILEDHGANHVRLRVWVNPADGYHDQAEAREMARRAHAAGPEGARGPALLRHLGRSRLTRPSRRRGPSFTTAQLTQAVYDHTYDVCRSVTVHGRGPAMIQIGNELNAGMLWPDGHTFDPPNWDNLAELPEGRLRRRQGVLAEHQGRAPPGQRRRQRPVSLVVRQHHAARRRAST